MDNPFHARLVRQWPLAIPFSVYILHSMMFADWLIDDAGITFAYARNLIHGLGLVAQAGVEPVEGYSNPLWTILISPVFVFDPKDPTFAIKTLSIILVLGSYTIILILYRVLLFEKFWSNLSAITVLTIVSTNTGFVAWTASGLENPLYALLTLLSLWLSISYLKQTTGIASPFNTYVTASLSGLAAAGLALTRPDGLMFLAMFPLILIFSRSGVVGARRPVLKPMTWFIALSLFPIVLYLSFRISYFGSMTPNTYVAKGGQQFDNLLGALTLSPNTRERTYELVSSIFPLNPDYLIAGALLLLPCLIVLIQNRNHGYLLIALQYLGCSWLIYILLPQDWMPEHRFGTPFLLLFPITLILVLAETMQCINISDASRRMIFLLLCAILVITPARYNFIRSLDFSRHPPVSFDLMAIIGGIGFNYYAEQLAIRNASLLIPDLGGTLYYSKHHVYDLAGLCDRDFAKLIKLGEKTRTAEHILSLKPTFIAIHEPWLGLSGLRDNQEFINLYENIHAKPGEPHDFAGHFVLKSAIASPKLLDNLRRQIDALGKDGLFNEWKFCWARNAKPFPRS